MPTDKCNKKKSEYNKEQWEVFKQSFIEGFVNPYKKLLMQKIAKDVFSNGDKKENHT